MLAARRSRDRDLAVAMMVSSALNPLNEPATARTLDGPDRATSTLGALLDLGEVDENDPSTPLWPGWGGVGPPSRPGCGAGAPEPAEVAGPAAWVSLPGGHRRFS